MSPDTCEIGILFCDIAGSTRLYETLGDARAHAAVQTALITISDVVLKSGGVVVKTVGDEVMAAFFRAAPMFDAAIEMQRRIMTLAPVDGPQGAIRIGVRIGFHFGAAIRNAGDYYGNTVNVAARMVALAKGGEIITTTDVQALVEPKAREKFRPLDSVMFRGKAEETSIAEIVWQATSELTQLPNQLRMVSQTLSEQALQLTYAGQSWALKPRAPPFLIGREPENTLCLADSRVSRRHATIERRLTSWVLIDHSSNGTFMTFKDGREIALRRQDLILHNAGTITFGSSGNTEHDPRLNFEVIETERTA